MSFLFWVPKKNAVAPPLPPPPPCSGSGWQSASTHLHLTSSDKTPRTLQTTVVQVALSQDEHFGPNQKAGNSCIRGGAAQAQTGAVQIRQQAPKVNPQARRKLAYRSFCRQEGFSHRPGCLCAAGSAHHAKIHSISQHHRLQVARQTGGAMRCRSRISHAPANYFAKINDSCKFFGKHWQDSGGYLWKLRKRMPIPDSLQAIQAIDQVMHSALRDEVPAHALAIHNVVCKPLAHTFMIVLGHKKCSALDQESGTSAACRSKGGGS